MDGNGLHALPSCSCFNTVKDTDGLNEPERSSSLRLTVSTLPFKLQVNGLHMSSLQDLRHRRATFKDLLESIEKQCRAMAALVFADMKNQADKKGNAAETCQDSDRQDPCCHCSCSGTRT